MNEHDLDILLRQAVKRRSESTLPDDFSNKIIRRLSPRKKRLLIWAVAAASVAAVAISIPFTVNNRASTSSAAPDYIGESRKEYNVRFENAASAAESMREDINEFYK